MEYGELFVMISGAQMMLKLFVNSWVFKVKELLPLVVLLLVREPAALF